ncbi:hypothetical protein [Prochlorococcus marinus]|uniref:hypothetical protein n=1 Tax=Prochlorococcus marinus TaxID=1219 RepID=UPI0022B2D18E|nr:hypothetical protein [Prochlorococcus marinus]
MRLSKGEKVTLKERLYIQEAADKDQSIASWLKKAKRMQQSKEPNDQIESLINDLNIGSSEPGSTYNPKHEDLGSWFSGAPSWVSRS